MDEGVSVVGVGAAGAAPDVVLLTLSLTCDGADVSVALRGAAGRAGAVAAAARAHGVTDRDLRSIGAHVHPVHTSNGMTVVAYRASSQLLVTVRDSAVVGAVVEAFVEAAGDALSVDQITLEIDDPSTLQRQAREAAYRDAEAKAAQFAELAGRRLGPVLAVTEAGHPSLGTGSGGAAMATRYATEAQMTSVEPGESTVRAAVSVRWAFAP